jgi:PAS domain S-box-containing protein
MTERRRGLPQRYRRALLAYMEGESAEVVPFHAAARAAEASTVGDEELLMEALELGRAALADGRSLLDLVSLHHRVVPGGVVRARSRAEMQRRFSRAEEFLRQVVAPFEMANRGWQEIVARLDLLNSSLERQIDERTAALRQSEQRFRDITEVAGDWIWESGPDHRFTFFVGQSLETVSVPPDSVLGRTWWELAGADPEQDQLWTRYKAVMDRHEPFRRYHHVVATPSGARLYVSASGKPVFDERGAFLGYRGTATDETLIINAHHRTEQAETLLRDAVESIYEGLAIFDADARLVTCNRAFREMHAECASALVANGEFEALLRAAVTAGLFPGAIGHEAAWLEARLYQHRHPAGAIEHRFRDGRWLLVTERRMSNGGTAGLYIDITALKQTQAALRDSEARLDRAQRIAAVGSWEFDLTTERFVWSKEMFRLRGLPIAAPPPGMSAFVRGVHEEDVPKLVEWFDQLRAGVQVPVLEIRFRRPNGEMRVADIEGQAISEGGKIAHIAGTFKDVTAQRSIERQLIQAQKMEAIGNLTGGMAHDFNNLLGVIIGNLDLLRDRRGGDPEIDELSREALDAATRGAELTRGLLAFARRQPLRPQLVDLNELVAGITKLIRRTLGERIEVVVELGREIWPVMADPVQLEAALTNLATNARDAMPKGGKLTFATRNRQLDPDYTVEHPDLAPGDYAMIEVSDQGIGIPQEDLGRVFEPFFSTKERGQGTGLGLAMVFGYIKQSGGHINVYSEVGVGTTFRLFLPRAAGGAAAEQRRRREAPLDGRAEVVLVVEDNAGLRRVAVRQLTALGYIVREAEKASAALSLLETEPRVDLLFSDVIMPGTMDGRELAAVVVERWPAIKVVLTSGFPGATVTALGEVADHIHLLSKPYRKDDLARALRAVLDGRPHVEAPDRS